MSLNSNPTTPTAWHLYLLECCNGHLYSGIAKDVQSRFEAHARGKGAKYTRANKPVRILGSLQYPDRSEASKAECRIKRLRPPQKIEFIQSVAA